jgi:hypothetical protein
MAFVINGVGTARPSGTSHSISVSDATAGDYEFVYILSEDPGTVWTTEISTPAGWDMDSTDGWIGQVDGINLYTAQYSRISDGDTSAVDFVSVSSLRFAMVRATLTGDSGSDIGRVQTGGEFDIDNATGALIPAQQPLGFFGDGTDPCDSILAMVADRTWADPGGFGAVTLIGDDDTSSVAIGTIRCTNYQLACFLIPEGDDPMQVGWTGPV